MRRREFIARFGGVGVPLLQPLAAFAQQAAPAVIGVLSGQSAKLRTPTGRAARPRTSCANSSMMAV
jgi:hypothetical protein